MFIILLKYLFLFKIYHCFLINLQLKMKILIIYLLTLSQIKKIKGKSEEFYECINLEKTITDSSNCINIKIPDSDGYKCCSMKITYNKDSSYSCFALENKYTTRSIK